MEDPTRHEFLTIRVTQNEQQLTRLMARAERVTVSELVRLVLRDRAEQLGAHTATNPK